ncbi:MAG: hypothetical protein ACJ789_14655 [Thermomicrobiales bacterium]
METTTPLSQVEETYLTHHRAPVRSAKWIYDQKDAFKLLHRFRTQMGKTAELAELTSVKAQAIADGLRDALAGVTNQVDCDRCRDCAEEGKSAELFEAGEIEPADADGDRENGSAQQMETG